MGRHSRRRSHRRVRNGHPFRALCRRVLVVDKAREGSDTLSTHGFGGDSPMPQLSELGLLDDVLNTGAPKLTSFDLDYDQGSIRIPIQNPWGYTLSVRRTALDPIFARHARESGAEVKYGVGMRNLVKSNRRVTGVVVDGPDLPQEHRARLVVGADGRHSRVGDLVGARSYDQVQSVTSAIYAYLEGVEPNSPDADALHFASGAKADSIIGPSDGGVACVLLILANDEFDSLRHEAAEAYDRRIQTIPAVARRIKNAKRVGRVRPVLRREVDGRFRVSHGPGWALVGDAGCKQHPAAGLGIGEAMRGAEILHDHVEGAWSAGQECDAALSKYQAARDAEFSPRYDLSFSMASLNPFDNGGIQRVMQTMAKVNSPGAVA